MNNVEIKVVKGMPFKELDKYVDLVVYGVARGTMDYTLSDNRFPRRSGNLQMSSMAHDPRKEKNGTYCLDVPTEAEYAKYVWKMENVAWTNPNTYPQWFDKVYLEKKELITQNAINNALRSVE